MSESTWYLSWAFKNKEPLARCRWWGEYSGEECNRSKTLEANTRKTYLRAGGAPGTDVPQEDNAKKLS